LVRKIWWNQTGGLTDTTDRITFSANAVGNEILLLLRPEDEDEEQKEDEEHGDIVHGSEHDDELVAQGGHEANQLENAQQTERA